MQTCRYFSADNAASGAASIIIQADSGQDGAEVRHFQHLSSWNNELSQYLIELFPCRMPVSASMLHIGYTYILLYKCTYRLRAFP